VQDVLGFMSIGVVVTKIMTFFQKYVPIGLDIFLTSGRSVQEAVGTVGLFQPAGWLAAAARWAATVT